MMPQRQFADSSKTIEPEFHAGCSFAVGLWERTCYMPEKKELCAPGVSAGRSIRFSRKKNKHTKRRSQKDNLAAALTTVSSFAKPPGCRLSRGIKYMIRARIASPAPSFL
jgi:hypothetical protein